MRMVCRLGGVCMLAAILGGCCVDSKTMEGSIADAVGELWFLMSIEMDRTVTLNPDGSGKMEMATRLSAKDFIASHGQHADMNLFKRYAYRYAQLLVVETNGIDAWSGVTVEFCENGDSIIKGVAYFRDPAAVGLSASAGPNGHGFVWLSYNSSSKIAMVDGTSLESGKKYAVVSISNAELQRKIQAAKGKCDERMSLIGTELWA